MILYKYCDEKGIDLLQNTRIKIANLAEINDPFEFLPQMDDEFDEFRKALNAVYEYQKANYRILSLSKAECNIIMWGHYSNKHKGILFKINSDKISREVEGENPFVQVAYSRVRPKIDLKTMISGKKEQLVQSLRLLTYTKYEDWRYEEEVRAIIKYDHKKNYDYLDIPVDSILEVILGMNSRSETEISTKSVLSQTRFHHVKLKKAEIDKKNYCLNYKVIKINIA
jgi:hypothetical protein